MLKKRQFLLLPALTLLLHIFACAEPAIAQDALFVSPEKTRFEMDVNPGQLSVKAAAGNLDLSSISAGGRTWTEVEVKGMINSMQPAFPVLPLMTRKLETGKDWAWKVSYTRLDSILLDLPDGLPIHPYQSSAVKGDTTFTWDEAVYTSDSWQGGPVLELKSDGIMRGVQIGRLEYHPVKYNPVRKQLIFYYNVEAELILVSGTASDWSRMNASFTPFIADLPQTLPSRQKRLMADMPLTMVIVADTMFREALSPFIAWKKLKGIKVIEAYTDDPEVGKTGTGIRNWLMSIYNNPPEGFDTPSYLLLVGDVQQIPLSPLGYQNTDLYYAEYDGNDDYIPDLFYGRISAQTVDQFVSVRDKILEYEQYAFPDPTFLNRSVLIAGVDASYSYTHANGQINYASSNYFNAEHGIAASVFLYPESASSDAQVLTSISNGAAFVNYTGHGTSDSWDDPTFSKADIAALGNAHKYPVLIGNGCQTNAFNNTECFSEAVTRASAKGALAYIGCTNDSYWDEDFYWSVGIGPIVANPSYESTTQAYYDKVFHENGEDPTVWAPSLGEMVFAGNMSVQESSSSKTRYYWEIYQLMGDPSLIPWFAEPDAGTAVYPSLLPLDIRQFGITVSPYDYISLTRNGEILDARHADEAGYANMLLPDTLTMGELVLVVTGDKRIPLIDTLTIGAANTAFLEALSILPVDETVEPVGSLSNGEEFSLALSFKNQGMQDFNPDTLQAVSLGSGLEVLDSLILIPVINPGDTIEIALAFRFRVKENISDQEQVSILLRCKHDTLNNLFYFREKAQAPVLSGYGLSWSDTVFGNGDGIINPGEELSLEWKIANTGHAPTHPFLLSYPDIQGLELMELLSVESADSIAPGLIGTIEFTVRISPLLYDTLYQGSAFVLADGNYMLEDSLRFVVDRSCENFQGRGFSFLDWTNDTGYPWLIDSLNSFNGRYSARSADIDDSGASSLQLDLYTYFADSLSFWYRVSSESSYDFLRFYVDDVEVHKWSGKSGWKRYAIYLYEGAHKLEWRYTKDNSLSSGEDAAWIDEIILPATHAVQSDLAIVSCVEPHSGAWLDREKLSISYRNLGTYPLSGVKAGYLDPYGNKVLEAIDYLIYPGEDYLYTFTDSLELGAVGEYSYTVFVSCANDSLHENDTLEVNISHYAFPDIVLGELAFDSVPGVSLDLRFMLENFGNIAIETGSYLVSLDGNTVCSGALLEPILPGTGQEYYCALISDQNDTLKTGWYPLRIEAMLENDSVPLNNFCELIVYWMGTNGNPEFRFPTVSVWPNPGRGRFFLNMDRSYTENITIQLVDQLGKVVYSSILEKGRMDMELDFNAAPGIYMLRLGELPVKPLKILVY